MTGFPDRDLLNPPYEIGHVQPLLSTGTIWGDLSLYGGYTAYDTHNLYASQMIQHTRQGLLDRRPNERPFIISRSTFAGDGRNGGHWTGDNASWWSHYLLSIFQHMEFASIFQMPMVGSDVCGFNDDTTETLCARWAMLGAWYPFYRNHADIQANFQEFYRWPLVTEVAKKAIATRFQLMDYFYTSFYQQTLDGSPTTITPLFFQYPEDPNTLEISYQFFYGPSILVSPVTVENATNVTFYLPEDTFYDFWTAEKMPETGMDVYYDNVTYMDIPVHIRGGSILPLRTNADQVNTTTQLREQDFELIIALDDNGKAKGNLYLDDGISINSTSSFMELTYDNGQLVVNGTFGYQTNVTMQYATIYGTNDTTPPIYPLNKALNSAWTADLSSSNNTVRSR
jgi:alpha-glucosidase